MAELREIVHNNIGTVWIDEFPIEVQREIVAQFRSDLLAAADRELPESDCKVHALQELRDPVALTERLDLRW